MKYKYLFIILLVVSVFRSEAQPVCQWAKQFGGTGDDKGISIDIDMNGNVYSTGEFIDSVDFDPGTGFYNLNSSGQKDIYVLKQDAGGAFLWAKSIGGFSEDLAKSITTDNVGNVYITGSFSDTVDFDPGIGTFNLTGGMNGDFFVCKLDLNGNFIWAKSLNGPTTGTTERGYSIEVDANYNIYTTGFFGFTMDFDPGPGVSLLNASGGNNIFISKWNSSGNFVWAKGFSGTGYNYGLAITTDLNSNVYTTGYFISTLDFDPDTAVFNLTSAGAEDVFILKLNSFGEFIWAKSIGDINNDYGYDIVVDANENIYTTGGFQGSPDFDPGAGVYTLSSNGSMDVFISRLDAVGNFVWAKSMGSINQDLGNSISLDLNENVYITGGYSNNDSVFILKLDSIGNSIWVQNIPSYYAYSLSMDLDQFGDIYCTGIMSGTMDFNTPFVNNLTSSGLLDVFVFKYHQCSNSSSPQFISACNSFTSFSGNYIWDVSGIYSDTLPGAFGCDSIITIDLTINTVDTSVTFNGINLTANASNATFQWLDCGNGNIILNGDTSQTFIPAMNGSYSVIVNQNGCVDTSGCYNITGVGIIDLDYLKGINVFPNPTTGNVYIEFKDKVSMIELKITDMYGKELIKTLYQDTHRIEVELGLMTGIYYLEVITNDHESTHKIVKL